MHTLEENFVSTVRSEVDNVMITVETRVKDAALTAIEKLGIPRVELAMKSSNASSGRRIDGNIWEPDQREFSGNIGGLQRTASSKIRSRTVLNRINETRRNITVEECDLLFNEKTLTGIHTFILRALFGD